MKKIIIKNNDGFTLAELVIVIALIGALAALALGPLKGLWSSGKVSAITQNISKLKLTCEQYAQMNGYNFNGLTAEGLQNDGLLPTNWTLINGDPTDIFPPNHSFTGYWIGTDAPGGVHGEFTIGVDSENNSITNNMALQLCNNFINQLAGFVYNDTAYSVVASNSCSIVIPRNNFPIPSGQFFLSFQ
ncbi:MAG: prepilin-type N-terminal cleavage/methylation domain-containing protein [Deltaproteobacteria bacterium]|jgi:prepilin-type N-terminal cleavage/methylation domain-containing protein|nr:prepilin-type N-terminal cleavage/methylation domain-containing protein [Deltaproteobacteria bacterium]MCL5880365.1 prepilin-type N-terminal cleavage/methylation domain-containing protein [Deltaproteobacteria bacterium]